METIPLGPIASLATAVVQGWRKVRVTVHRGYLVGSSDEQLFINVTNLSPKREVEVIRVWFATSPNVEVFNPARPLPKRLRCDESWETWTPVSQLPSLDLPYAGRKARVQLSSGKTISSMDRKDVPPYGNVPGGS
jgi:hypothetical protein